MSRSKKPFRDLNVKLQVETLENRVTPCTALSGYVYFDANNDGLYDPSTETPIANSTLELRDLNDNVIASTTTDADGFYKFDTDFANPTTDATLTKTVTFDPTQTNFELTGLLDQFDPSLGQLESIEIQHTGSITSEIKAENFSRDSESEITGIVSGTLTLSGPGMISPLTISGSAGSFHAQRFDGITDFDGDSGGSFGEQTADGSETVFITGSDMDAYIGAGQVEITETAIATSTATGGGNLDVRVRSTAQSTVTVIYHYKAYDCLQPGDYKIVQSQQPDGFIDGLESMDGIVDPNSVGTDTIFVTLGDVDLVHNDFGELKTTQLSGHVWHDANNDGVRDVDEAPIPGTFITLEGPDGIQTTVTDDNGYYEFTNLLPGTYTVKETQPADFLDGKDNAGTLGGNVVNDPAEDQIQEITLNAGDDSENNDFGEIKPASIAGHVWHDANDDGVRDPDEAPIADVTVTLTGFDDQGPVVLSTTTDSLGEYSFTNLRPGTYALNETQPGGYIDGKDTIGTPGGMTANDEFSNIQLPSGFNGVDNDFGELRPETPPIPLPKNVTPLGLLPVISKVQLTEIPEPIAINATLRAEMAFIVGSTITLTGRQLDAFATLNAVDRLHNGLSPASFVNELWASDAHRAWQASAIYQDVLGRLPTAQEKAATIAELKAGATELAVKENLFVSADYQALYPSSEEFAAALYQDILNTVPGSQSVQMLVQSMGNEPLQDVVHGLLTSEEAIANQIDDVYRLTLRRAATANEIQTWATPIKTGTTTLDALTRRLLASQEFYQLCFSQIT